MRIEMSFVAAIAALLALSTAPALAQGEEEFDSAEVVKKIQKDLEALVQGFSGLTGSDLKPGEGERVVENIDKLLEGLSGDQERVMKNIDELIRNMKQQQSSSSSSESDSQSKPNQPKGKPKSRDRNQKPKDQRPDQKSGKQRPEDRKDGESDPKGGEEERDPQQRNSGKRPPESPEEKTPPILDPKTWGHLPPETQQILIDSNFREYFPDYEREIGDYLKSVNRKKN